MRLTAARCHFINVSLSLSLGRTRGELHKERFMLDEVDRAQQVGLNIKPFGGLEWMELVLV